MTFEPEELGCETIRKVMICPKGKKLGEIEVISRQVQR